MLINISTATVFFLGIVFCAASWYKKWLTARGALAAFILGVVIMQAGGIKLAIPMLIFFVAGSLLSKLPSNAKQADYKAKKPRNAMQVFCNGGIAGLCIALFAVTGKSQFVVGYFISIAVSASDTFSSELGNYFRGNVYDITSFKQTTKGLSGGVSLNGTLAGFAGACLIAFCYFILPHASLSSVLIITVCGIAGMLLDSILGSLVQAKFAAGDNSVWEEKNTEEVRLISGVSWVNNDLVNLLSNALITLFAVLLFLE